MQKLTRRELAAIATASLTSLTAARLIAQTAPSAADDLYRAALESNKQDAAVLAQFEIPMSTEPAFQFKA